MLADLGPEAVRLQARTFERLVIGQISETQGGSEGLSLLQHYIKVIEGKTGSLIATSARFGAMFAGAPQPIVESLTRFGEKIGIVFQLADDVLDVESESAQSGKTPGTDLREGVPTLVTLFILESEKSEDAALKEILRAPIEDEAIVADVLQQLRSHGALIKAKELVQEYLDGALAELATLPDGASKAALISLCNAIAQRSA